METPVRIEFHDVEATELADRMVREKIDELESRYGRITACHVVVKGPGGHHQTGGLFGVRVHLALPAGQQIDVDRTNQGDERLADMRFAIADAFKRARRRLQDQARRLQGQVKRHSLPKSPVAGE